MSARSAKSGIGILTANLDRPRVEEALDPISGLIPAALTNGPLTITWSLTRYGVDGDWHEAQIRNLAFAGEAWITVAGPDQYFPPPSGTEMPITLPLPSTDTGGWEHGRYEVRYLLYPNDGTATGDRPAAVGETSFAAPLTIDLIPPYSNGRIDSPPPAPIYAGPPIPGGVIDAGFLAGAGAGGLTFTIPDNTYPTPSGQWALGDTIQYYFSENLVPQPAFEVGAINPPRPMAQTGNTFVLPASAITSSGRLNFFCTITDRAGNVSAPSIAAVFTVLLLPTPVLQPVVIPLAPAPEDGGSDNLLNIADYVAGIVAHARDYTPLPTTDQIQLIWGTQPATPLGPVTAFPHVFTNLNALIRAEYGNQRGPQPVEVYFRVMRGGQPTDSPLRTVNVDLSVPGAENPGEPGTANPNLNPLRIFGQGSLVPNELRAVHANNPVTVSIDLWSFADPPQPGQFIHVVWSNGTVITPPFEITTQSPAETINFTIPWSVVDSTGNGPQVVYYFVASSATPQLSDNRNIAPTTTVNVIDAVTRSLAPPEFVGFRFSQGAPIWNCDSLVILPRAIRPARDRFVGRIFVAADDRFVQGEDLTLVVRAFHPRVVPIRDDTSAAFTLPVTATGQVNGYTFMVPLDDLKAVNITGTVEATLTTPIAGGFLGLGVASIHGRTVLSQDFCDLTPAPAPATRT